MKEIGIDEEKQIALGVLVAFAEFCEKNNLKYILAYGTLLGAIRHKGYIPWDDDIDIMMPREDYERALVLFPEHPYLKMMDISVNPCYGKFFGCLNDTRTIKRESLTRKRCNGTVSVNIDIFPVDNLPDDRLEQKALLQKIRKLETAMACLTYRYGKGRTPLSTIKKNLGILCYRTLELCGITTIEKLNKRHHLLLNAVGDNTYTAGSLTNTGFNGIKEFLPKDVFEETILVDFEGYKLRAPKNYHTMLSHIYGDYMELPPIDKRVSHHENNCYWVAK